LFECIYRYLLCVQREGTYCHALYKQEIHARQQSSQRDNYKKGKWLNGNNRCGKQGRQKADCLELLENAAMKPSSYQGCIEQTNVHMHTSRGVGIEFVLCDINTYPVLMSSRSLTDEVQKEKQARDEVSQLDAESELGSCWKTHVFGLGILEPHAVGMVPMLMTR